ncbi:MAG: hypothetical protein JWO33_1734 [Caulobacteraceae bacterium]|nr:hypothetical protein [Caulobacteraceae bacterium]
MSVASEDRYVSIDAVRGFAVLGILLMNIVSMGLPSFAYIDPTYYGGAEGPNLWTWATNFVVADGKMRTLFTMLFGASMVLIAERAERGSRLGPVQTHYRRSFWLFVIGIAHHVFLWIGDILMFYAVAGALAFPLRKLKPWLLVALGLAVYFALMGHELSEQVEVARIQAAAQAPGAGPAALEAWKQAASTLGPPPQVLQVNLTDYGSSGFWHAAKARFGMMIFRHTVISRMEYVEAFGLILAGMGLFRLGFFTLKWPTRVYAGLIAAGYLVGVPITVYLAWRVTQARFDLAALQMMSVLSEAPRLLVAMAHASVILLMVRAGLFRSLIERLVAAGRMALSNYLASSLIGSIVFAGYGFGLYGHLQRWQLYIVVAGVWATCLLWSKPWMERFQYGPMEWVWRSLVQLKPQPFLRPRPALAPAV